MVSGSIVTCSSLAAQQLHVCRHAMYKVQISWQWDVHSVNVSHHAVCCAHIPCVCDSMYTLHDSMYTLHASPGSDGLLTEFVACLIDSSGSD